MNTCRNCASVCKLLNLNVTRFLQGYQVLVRRVSLERGVDHLYIAAAGGGQPYAYTGERFSYAALQFHESSFNVYANIQYVQDCTVYMCARFNVGGRLLQLWQACDSSLTAGSETDDSLSLSSLRRTLVTDYSDTRDGF